MLCFSWSCPKKSGKLGMKFVETLTGNWWKKNSLQALPCNNTESTQYAHDVVLTSVRRCFDVIDVVWTSKRRLVLTGYLSNMDRLNLFANICKDSMSLTRSIGCSTSLTILPIYVCKLYNKHICHHSFKVNSIDNTFI